MNDSATRTGTVIRAVSSPIDLVLDRLANHRVRACGPDRWRACCPGHNGDNPSALSVGVGAEGQVLLNCWQGCHVDQIVSAIGLDLIDLFPSPHSQGSSPSRRRTISASQALELLHNEAQLIALCASNIAHDRALTADDRARCLIAAGRIAYLRDEVCK